MNILRVYLKVFLSGAISFGVLVSPFFLLAYGYPLGVFAAGLAGFMFGFIVTFISAPKQIGLDGREMVCNDFQKFRWVRQSMDFIKNDPLVLQLR